VATDSVAGGHGDTAGGARYTAWEHYEGIAALLVAHLVEMWCLRLFGRENLEAEMRLLAEAVPLAPPPGQEPDGWRLARGAGEGVGVLTNTVDA